MAGGDFSTGLWGRIVASWVMNRFLLATFIVGFFLLVSSHAQNRYREHTPSKAEVRVLCFSGTGWYRHPDIPAINHWLVKTGANYGIQIDVSETAKDLSSKRLADYDVLLLNNANTLDKVFDAAGRPPHVCLLEEGQGSVAYAAPPPPFFLSSSGYLFAFHLHREHVPPTTSSSATRRWTSSRATCLSSRAQPSCTASTRRSITPRCAAIAASCRRRRERWRACRDVLRRRSTALRARPPPPPLSLPPQVLSDQDHAPGYLIRIGHRRMTGGYRSRRYSVSAEMATQSPMARTP